MNTLQKIVLTIAPVILAACGTGNSGSEGTGSPPSVTAAPEQTYLVKFKASEVGCLLQNANVNTVSVFRVNGDGTTSEVPLETCK